MPSKDPEALANALERLARDRQTRRQYGAASRERAEQDFGIDRMIREYERLYLELGARRAGVFALPQIDEA